LQVGKNAEQSETHNTENHNMKNTTKDLFESIATITPAETASAAEQVTAARSARLKASDKRHLAETVANKLYWATRAIEHAIAEVQPGQTQANLVNTLAVIKLDWTAANCREVERAIRKVK
jgi:hypothetical protein